MCCLCREVRLFGESPRQPPFQCMGWPCFFPANPVSKLVWAAFGACCVVFRLQMLSMGSFSAYSLLLSLFLLCFQLARSLGCVWSLLCFGSKCSPRVVYSFLFLCSCFASNLLGLWVLPCCSVVLSQMLQLAPYCVAFSVAGQLQQFFASSAFSSDLQKLDTILPCLVTTQSVGPSWLVNLTLAVLTCQCCEWLTQWQLRKLQ